jgi:16S rRNA (uracil1498-N3)-methyltransferase
MSAPRLYVDASLAPGATIDIDAARARYLNVVLRLEAGGLVRVFNGVDGEWSARIAAVGKRGGVLEAIERLRAQTDAADLILLFAPVKRHATDLIVEKATEMGVRALRPVITRRTVAETVRLDRLRAIVTEAAEQTERLELPDVEEPETLPRLLDGWDANRALIFADEAGDDDDADYGSQDWNAERGRARPIGSALTGVAASSVALLIGPEGGFHPEERRMLRGLPYVTPISLGPRILRAETAVIAGLAVIQSIWGDWKNR